jgi:hypothetical protein
MTVQEMKPVAEDVFRDYLRSYPAPLKRNVSHIYEPPLVTYNDFRLGKWPESVVAGHSFEDREATIPKGFRVRASLPTEEELAAAIHETQSLDTSARRETGLRDISGKPVFEGDRVRVEWGWTMDPISKATTPMEREHMVLAINDQHDRLVRWSLSGCYNEIDSFVESMVLVEPCETRVQPEGRLDVGG